MTDSQQLPSGLSSISHMKRLAEYPEAAGIFRASFNPLQILGRSGLAVARGTFVAFARPVGHLSALARPAAKRTRTKRITMMRKYLSGCLGVMVGANDELT